MSDDMPDFSNVKGGSSSTAAKVYVVVSGDSLSKIAKREYGNAKEWNRIYEANRDILKPLLAEKLAAKSAGEWFDQLIAVGVPCGPINTVDKGVAFAEKIGLDPIVTAGAGERSRPTMRHPVTFSKTPASYPLAPPELDEQGAEIRAWLAAPEGDEHA